MTNSKTRTRAAVAAALLAASALPAMAEGLYVGGSIAKPDWRGDNINGVSGDSSGTGLKLYGGYQFNPPSRWKALPSAWAS